MNKKRTTVLSSIAACAVIISLAVMVQSPVSAAADTAYKVRNVSTSVVKST